MASDNITALYFHWPYCLQKCPYCDFNSHTFKTIEMDLWKNAYINEINKYSEHIVGKQIKSIYFGGGTPSLMNPEIVASIIEKLNNIAILDHNTEITLEANPSSTEISNLKRIKDAGVNRISLGIQSLRDHNLNFLGRIHNSLDGIKAIEKVNQHFSNYSFDLMYCLPNQTQQEWILELNEALSLAINHISLYQLTIEKGTSFYSLHKEGAFVMPQEDQAADLYQITNEIMSSYNFEAYEISNYSRNNFKSNHNLAYWNYEQYLGIGPGAHSRIVKNNKLVAAEAIYNPNTWLKAALSPDMNTLQKETILTDSEIASEVIMMGLRIANGITEEKIKLYINKSFEDVLNYNKLLSFVEQDLIIFNNERIKLTPKGRLLHGYLVSQILRDDISF